MQAKGERGRGSSKGRKQERRSEAAGLDEDWGIKGGGEVARPSLVANTS